MHFTVRKQIGVARDMNRALVEKVRCLFSNAKLDKSFWAEALEYTGQIINRLSSTVIGGKTLLKFWSCGVAQGYDLLRMFRCPTYFRVKEGNLDP